MGELALTNSDCSVSYLTWTSPFTFNLQISPPFILYCIDVWKTRGLPKKYNELIYSICDWENLTFAYNFSRVEFTGCDKLVFTIIPVNLVGNGTSASVNGPQLNNSEGMMAISTDILS